MKPEIKEIMKLAKLSPAQKNVAENYYMNLSMKFKTVNEGLSKTKIIMAKYKLSFQAAYDAIMDPSQLEILKTMNQK